MIVGAIMSKYDKKWREENPEKWRESNRKAMAKWRAKCPEKVAANQLRHFIRKYPGIALEIFVAQNSTSNNTERDEINRLANGALESLSNRNLVMLKLLIDDILRLTSPIS